jgi:HAE1 family hydrophobic/amphiphilic exporter-1
VDLKEAMATIDDNLARSGLPTGVTPSVQAFNFNAAPVMIVSLAAKGSTTLERVAEIARTELQPELRALAGVASAELAGGEESRLLITLEPTKLAGAGVSVQQISGILQANNLTIPGGELPVEGARIPVSTIGRFESIDAVRNLVVGAIPPSTPGGFPTPVTLGSLGTVELANIATTGYGRTNGLDAITVSVAKTSAANTVTVSRESQAIIDEVAARYPNELEVVPVYDQSTFILESTDGLLREGGLGAVFAVLTIFLFLFNLRSTAIAAVSIPLSILTALVIMGSAGITLNILTLGGLAVAVGRVVDDSIVVLENIYRHRAMGDDRLKAVIDGPREVAGAITASTVTTVAVFLPLGFAGGFVSSFFLAFSLTVTFALLASLIVALTVVPVLAFLMLGR